MYSVHCSLYIVHCTLYIVDCTLYIVHCTLYIVHASTNLPCKPLPDIATLEHQSWEFSELHDVIGDQLLVGRVELVAKAAHHDLEEGGHTVEDWVGGEGDEGRGGRGSVLPAQPGLPQLLDLLEERHGIVAVKLVVLSTCRGELKYLMYPN